MPVRISNLTRDRRTVTVPVGDETLSLTYKPSALTPEAEDRMRELVDDQRAGASLAELLSTMLAAWDLTDDNGQPLATDATALRQLPTIFLGQVVQAITEDMRPNQPSGATSAAG